MTQTGIQISSVRKYLQTPADVLSSFRKVSQIGYRFIQIQWIAPSVPADFIRAALQETGLVCIGTQDYTDVVLSQWEKVLGWNDLWGGTYICVSGIPERYQSAVGCLEFAADLNRRSASLEQQGKILTFHPRSSDVLRFGEKNSLELIQENTRPQLQFVMDVFHFIKAGLDPLDWMLRLEGRNDLMHFKDFSVDSDGREALVPTGQGKVDWGPIFRACRQTGVKYGFAEQESWQKDPFECLEESYSFIKEGLEG